MLNILLALIVGMVMGWSFHAFFVELSTPKFLKPDINLSTLSNREINTSTIVKEEQEKPKETLSQPTSETQEKNLEPIDYPQKIQTILAKIETAPAHELEQLYHKLIRTSQHYITQLNKEKNQVLLVEFLESQIELNVQSNFYIYQLALEFFKQERYDETITLLKEIEYDYEYEEKVKALLKKIEEKRTKDRVYSHQFPLTKIGDHFTLTVQINNMDYTLLLDTGASLTMINDVKLPLLPTVQENVTLNTAGGEIVANIKEAESFSLGNLELRNFHIVSASFENENYDGLLGMNFFKKFQFKIDQNNSLLLLSHKDEKL
jgi:clan AA aspartic protease (TIGR02281 family)